MIGKFFRKYRIKALIFVMAVVVWLHVKTEMVYEDVIPVRVVPTNENPEFVIVNDFTESIPVKFQGRGKSLIVLKNSNVEILADLNQTNWSEYVAKLNFQDIRISPPLINIVPLEFLEKDTIHFRLEPLRYKKVVVKSRIRVKPKAGFTQVGDLGLEPDRVNISGPLSYIRKVKSIVTDSLVLNDLTAPVTGRVDLQNPFPGKIVLGDQSVAYSLDIQQIGERVFEDIPIVVRNGPLRRTVRVTPSTISVKVVGGVNVLSNLKRSDILALIDFQKYRKVGRVDAAFSIKLPEYVTYSEIFPMQFQLKVE